MLQENIELLDKHYEQMIREMQTQKNQDEIDGPSALIKALKENREKFKCLTLGEHKKEIEKITTEIKTMQEKISQHITGYNKLANDKLDVDTEIKVYEMLLDYQVKRLKKVTVHNSNLPPKDPPQQGPSKKPADNPPQQGPSQKPADNPPQQGPSKKPADNPPQQGPSKKPADK